MVKYLKLFTCLAVLTALIALCCAAAAEQARVVTPGGTLNIRKTPDEKGKLVDSVPNKALVEVNEIGETWTKITYKKKTGYVKTEYLRLAQNMLDKTVYPDEGTVFLLSEQRADAPVSAVLTPLEGVLVRVVADGWAHVYHGETNGYV